MKRFIDEQIEVELHKGSFLEKKPQCPKRFYWREKCFEILELRSAWQEFSRKGNSSKNMREEHLKRAIKKGSWGVGRYYFAVLGTDHCVYTIYYDRAPMNSHDRKGKWILLTREEP